MTHFDIRLTTQELDYLANTLAQRPWGEVNQLLANIKGQIDTQQKLAAIQPDPVIERNRPMPNGGIPDSPQIN